MRLLLPLVFYLVVVATVFIGGHSIYVSQTEFKPASARFRQALKQHDQAAMEYALNDEQRAIDRESPLWWLESFE
jgi:hypothetical protein